jgi:Holliday junction DNA helicase RuvA
MIAYLRGTVRFKRPSRVVIDVGGVGYDVSIPVSTFYSLEDEGREAALHIHTQVREDALALYGFKTEREKTLFEKLISVSQVGPKLAITILSGLEFDELIAALRKGDLVALTHMPGVGKKTAERLVLELRDKLTELSAPGAPADTAPATKPAVAGDFSAIERDVLSALVNLGYNQASAEAAVREVRKAENPPGDDIEQMLRLSLRLLGRKFFSVK